MMITETAPSALPDLRGYWLWLARVVWVLIALLCISLFALGTIAQYDLLRAPCSDLPLEVQSNCMSTENALRQLGLTWDDLAAFYTPIATIAALPFILIGCLVFWYKSGNRIGLLFSFVLVALGSAGTNLDLINALSHAYPNLRILVAFLQFLGSMAPAIFFCLFPDGRFVPRWASWLLLLWAGHQLYISISFFVPSFENSFWMKSLDPIFIILLIAAAIYAMIFRYRYDAGPIQRQQIKWVTAAAVVAGIFRIGFFILRPFWQPGFFDVFMLMVYSELNHLGVLFVGVCLGISISHYRLWDIDVLINRTLVYSLLTAFIVGLYVIVVGILGTTIQERSSLLISILSTGLVAVLVQPLRDHLQRGINRLMYGERDDPVTVISRLGQRLEATLAPDAVLPSLVETVAQTLKLPYVAIETMIDQQLASQLSADPSPINASSSTISYGSPQPDVIRQPLVYQSETIGQLVVAPRAPGEALSPMDRHLLESIAHQAGMAVHAVNLTANLQRSRQRVVTAREEERRRLRRDLHDGLGPNLASQGLKLAAARQLLDKDPASAVPLLDQVMAQNQSTVEEVRRLVYGLRPPALDELGLIAAIRDYVAGMDGKSTLQIEITEPPEGLPPLSAAVEVAAYRIVLEALTNVIRHAQAKHCSICFSTSQNGATNTLQIEILDDGIGLPKDMRAGVGLRRTRHFGVGTRSMRERAEEVGGTFTIESSSNRGTCIRAQFPLDAPLGQNAS